MVSIKKIKRRLKDSYLYWRLLSNTSIAKYYTTAKLGPEDVDDMRAAKRLHAAVYLSRGFIDHSEVREGMIHDVSDPHQHHSQYFVVKRGEEVVGVARQITYKGMGSHHESFPVLDKAILHERSRRRILATHPQEITEISALVKKSGESALVPLLLYRELWKHSLHTKHRIWIMACDVRLYQRLKVLFGPTLTKIGQRTPYQGGDVIPASLNIAAAVRYVEDVKSRGRIGIFDVPRRAAGFITGPGKKSAKHEKI